MTVPALDIIAVDWRAFDPPHRRNRRGGGQIPAQAHAFEPEGGDGQGTYSLCGYVERGRTGGVASPVARRCLLCERVFRGTAKPVDQWTRVPRGWKP